MQNINSNINELKKIISQDVFKTEEAEEFLEAIQDNADELQKELSEAKSDLKDALSNIEDLKEKAEESSSGFSKTVDCGIGKVSWQSDNLKLQMMMEDFFEKQGYKNAMV